MRQMGQCCSQVGCMEGISPSKRDQQKKFPTLAVDGSDNESARLSNNTLSRMSSKDILRYQPRRQHNPRLSNAGSFSGSGVEISISHFSSVSSAMSLSMVSKGYGLSNNGSSSSSSRSSTIASATGESSKKMSLSSTIFEEFDMRHVSKQITLFEKRVLVKASSVVFKRFVEDIYLNFEDRLPQILDEQSEMNKKSIKPKTKSVMAMVDSVVGFCRYFIELSEINNSSSSPAGLKRTAVRRAHRKLITVVSDHLRSAWKLESVSDWIQWRIAFLLACQMQWTSRFEIGMQYAWDCILSGVCASIDPDCDEYCRALSQISLGLEQAYKSESGWHSMLMSVSDNHLALMYLVRHIHNSRFPDCAKLISFWIDLCKLDESCLEQRREIMKQAVELARKDSDLDVSELPPICGAMVEKCWIDLQSGDDVFSELDFLSGLIALFPLLQDKHGVLHSFFKQLRSIG